MMLVVFEGSIGLETDIENYDVHTWIMLQCFWMNDWQVHENIYEDILSVLFVGISKGWG